MQVTPANEVLNFVADNCFFDCLCCDLCSDFSFPLHCLISLGHFSLMSDHAVISVGSSYLHTRLTASKTTDTEAAYKAEPILCAFGGCSLFSVNV